MGDTSLAEESAGFGKNLFQTRVFPYWKNASRRNNKEALDRIADSLRTSYADSVYQLKRIQVVGGASPEGSIPLEQTFVRKACQCVVQLPFTLWGIT